jgi:hypothetical protein
MNYTQHPLSAAFPAMNAEEYQALKDSIEVNGVLNPITIFEDMVLDGWHRYTAANDLGMDCPSLEMDDSIDPIDFVKAQNENRRHLTASERTAAIVAIYKWVPTGTNQHSKRGDEPGSPPQKTNAELAALAGTTTRTVQQVKAAEKAGLLEAVRDGALTAKEAAKIAAGKPPKAPAKPEKFTPPAVDNSDELAESAQAISQLSEEVELLEAKLAVKHMDATGEEKSQAATLIADLRAQVKTLNAELDAMRTSRDGLQRENRELMKQIAIYQRQLKQAQKV